jgi:hypothetical protein
MRSQYAGVTLRVALVRVKFFTLGIGSLIGGGRACLNDERLDRCVNRAAMFVAEPELGSDLRGHPGPAPGALGRLPRRVAQAWSGPAERQLGGLTGTLGFRSASSRSPGLSALQQSPPKVSSTAAARAVWPSASTLRCASCRGCS